MHDLPSAFTLHPATIHCLLTECHSNAFLICISSCLYSSICSLNEIVPLLVRSAGGLKFCFGEPSCCLLACLSPFRRKYGPKQRQMRLKTILLHIYRINCVLYLCPCFINATVPTYDSGVAYLSPGMQWSVPTSIAGDVLTAEIAM
jgi:hypothetical protein